MTEIRCPRDADMHITKMYLCTWADGTCTLQPNITITTRTPFQNSSGLNNSLRNGRDGIDVKQVRTRKHLQTCESVKHLAVIAGTPHRSRSRPHGKVQRKSEHSITREKELFSLSLHEPGGFSARATVGVIQMLGVEETQNLL